MKFLVDAQLPARLARFLNDAGHEALHTAELPDGNRTTDTRIAELADSERRVVVTKDRTSGTDTCCRSHRARLLIVTTGNITNAALLALAEANLPVIVGGFTQSDFVELCPDALVVHRRRGDGPAR